MVSFLLLVGAFGLFEVALRSSGNEDLARTMAVNTFVFGEMFYLFNCRSLTRSFWQLGVLSNGWLWTGVGIMVVLQAVFTYLPVFNSIFRTHPMGAGHWTMVLGYSAMISVIVGMEKRVSARRRKTGG